MRAVYGVEREFDRYYMRLKQSTARLIEDPSLFNFSSGNGAMLKQHGTKHWVDEDHDLEQIENH